jgi:hypothetical protein
MKFGNFVRHGRSGTMTKKERDRQRCRARASATEQGILDPPWLWAVPSDSARAGTPKATELASQLAADNEVACCATFINDPIFGAVLPVRLRTTTGSADAVTEAPPVLLLEPVQVMPVKDARTGTVREMRTESLIDGGFQRLAGYVWRVEPARGWGVYRNGSAVILRDGDGQIVARAALRLDPAWVSAAVSQRRVLVLHGYPLGVRIPPSKTEEAYTVQERAQEIAQARHNGLLAGALVEWGGTFSEALEWVRRSNSLAAGWRDGLGRFSRPS